MNTKQKTVSVRRIAEFYQVDYRLGHGQFPNVTKLCVTESDMMRAVVDAFKRMDTVQ